MKLIRSWTEDANLSEYQILCSNIKCRKAFFPDNKFQIYCHKRCRFQQKNYRRYHSESYKKYIEEHPEYKEIKKKSALQWQKKKGYEYQKEYRAKKGKEYYRNKSKEYRLRINNAVNMR